MLHHAFFLLSLSQWKIMSPYENNVTQFQLVEVRAWTGGLGGKLQFLLLTFPIFLLAVLPLNLHRTYISKWKIISLIKLFPGASLHNLGLTSYCIQWRTVCIIQLMVQYARCYISTPVRTQLRTQCWYISASVNTFEKGRCNYQYTERYRLSRWHHTSSWAKRASTEKEKESKGSWWEDRYVWGPLLL